jgi:hypothetical protein
MALVIDNNIPDTWGHSAFEHMGNIFVENIEINRHRAQARSHLGVCPQYDAMD